MLATSSPDRFLGWAVARAVVHRHNGPPNPNNRLVFFKSF